MAMHYHVKEGEAFDWSAFQNALRLSDEELKIWRSDPKKEAMAPIMCGEAVQSKYLILEVIDSHGCANGLEPGERLVFENFGMLDPERSDKWCAHAMGHATLIADACHNLVLKGIDPNEGLYPNVFSCSDTTVKYGWGLMTYKAFVVDKDDLDKYPPLRLQKKTD